MGSDAWTWLGTGGGEAGLVMRGVNWSDTPVGPVDGWPPQLKSIIAMMLYARQPMFLWWGRELVQFYNDGYIPSFGVGRHPSAMGQRGKECWAEIWPIIGPEIESVVAQREATYHDDALVPIFRNGRMEEVYWTYGYSPVFDASGNVAGVLVVVTETTTRVLAMRRLCAARRLADALTRIERTEDLLRRAVEALEDERDDITWAVVLEEPSGVVLGRSRSLSVQAAAQVAALVREPDTLVAIDLAIEGLPGGPWPESSTRAVVVPLRARKDTAVRTKLAMGLSPRLPYDASYEEHVLDISRLIDDAAQRVAFRAARAAAERSRNDLLLQAPMAAALVAGPEWRFELANRAYVELVGREVLGRRWRDCFPELIGSEVEAILQRVYHHGEAIVSSERLVPLARNGVVEERYFDFNVIPIRGRRGEIESMMVVAVELTAQVSARHDLEQTAIEREELVRELRAASRSKDEFVAMLGHELRNPLAPIATALSLLEMRDIQGIDRERAVIARQVQHLTRLVDDLLDVARLTSHKVKLSLEVVDVAHFVAQGLELATPLIEERAQRVRVTVPAGLRVRGDANRLAQVLGNLLSNASKYSDVESQIAIVAEQRGDQVAISVRDQGTGIDAEMLPRVFDTFAQERQSLSRSSGGLGLGLAIVRNLIVLHGGTVSAESAGRDRGATFTIMLPLCDEEVDARAKAEPSAPPGAAAAERRVLIVDDNEDAAELLALALRKLGHVTCVAADGPSALSLVDGFKPDLALLDIGLPVMDGYELARHLRIRVGTQLQMYALTGYGQEEDRRLAQDAGFDAHFVKPVDIVALMGAVEQERLSKQ